MRHSWLRHPSIAPLLEKWQREAVEAATTMHRQRGMSESLAGHKALQELGPEAKITGEAVDPDGDTLPAEWGSDPGFDDRGQPRFRTRNLDFMSTGEFLRRVLEEPLPHGSMPEDLQRELDDLLQDHQYDGEGRRMVLMSMMDGLDPVLSRIYRNRMGAIT